MEYPKAPEPLINKSICPDNSMSKLDEIQERIDLAIASRAFKDFEHAMLVVLTEITAELKRIDAEQRRHNQKCPHL